MSNPRAPRTAVAEAKVIGTGTPAGTATGYGFDRPSQPDQVFNRLGVGRYSVYSSWLSDPNACVWISHHTHTTPIRSHTLLYYHDQQRVSIVLYDGSGNATDGNFDIQITIPFGSSDNYPLYIHEF